MSKRLIFNKRIGEYDYYEYKPSIFKPFHVVLEPISVKKRIRLLLAYISGYTVYYLGNNNEYIGYCLVQSGKDKRYRFATEKDIIVGPYFIREDYRGKKLSISLLDYILNKAGLNFRYAYDYIHKGNIPSIKTSEAVGFQYLSDAKISMFIRAINLCNTGEGDYLIYKYSNL